MEMMIYPPLSLPTRFSLYILNLNFSLDMERWLIPRHHCCTNQNLTENFKFEDLGWTWKDDWPPLWLTSNVTDKS